VNFGKRRPAKRLPDKVKGRWITQLSTPGAATTAHSFWPRIKILFLSVAVENEAGAGPPRPHGSRALRLELGAISDFTDPR